MHLAFNYLSGWRWNISLWKANAFSFEPTIALILQIFRLNCIVQSYLVLMSTSHNHKCRKLLKLRDMMILRPNNVTRCERSTRNLCAIVGNGFGFELYVECFKTNRNLEIFVNRCGVRVQCRVLIEKLKVENGCNQSVPLQNATQKKVNFSCYYNTLDRVRTNF